MDALDKEIRARLGVVPEVFRDPRSTGIAERRWGYATAAYLESEIPFPFREELVTYLSRFCEQPYCMVRHAAFLLAPDFPGGSPGPARAAKDVVELLSRPIPSPADLERHLRTLADNSPSVASWPVDARSPLGAAVIACTSLVFLPGPSSERCLAALRHLLGPQKLEALLTLLGFVRGAHGWSEEDLADGDERLGRELEALLVAHPELRVWVDGYRPLVQAELSAYAADPAFRVAHALGTGRAAAPLGAILEDSLNEILVFDAKTLRFSLVNRGARENLGYSMSELLELTLLDLVPDLDAQRLEALLAPLRSGERSSVVFETVHQRKDGSVYPVETHVHFSEAAEGAAFAAIVLDTTERDRQRDRIQESEARARTVLNTAADAIVTISDHGIIEGVNPATLRLFGYAESELVGSNVRILMPPPYSDEHDGYLRRYRETREPRIIGEGREVTGRRKDGSLFPLWLSVGEAIFDHRRLYTGIIHDLSVQKEAEAERRSLHEQLMQSQKLEAIGTLAGGIAHDFNNLLTSIRGSAEILVGDLESEGKMARAAERILRASDRATALTQRLLGFSRKQTPQHKPVDVNEIVHETSDLLERTLPESVELESHLEDGAVWTHADSGQVAQVLMNLIVNAVDAMPDGGRVVVSTESVSVDVIRARELGIAAGEFVVLSVADTGAGIADSVISRIFDPFFTTKPVGKGTGLGLSTSLAIVREHEGVLHVESEPGAGTKFSVWLPAIDAPSDEPSARVSAPVRAKAEGETILLLEDDPIMRELLTEVLEAEGYIVRSAGAPGEALELAANEAIDLLITDVIMPDMNGFELSKELRQRHPKLTVLYMSGYTNEVLSERGQLAKGDPFLRKPFGNKVLLETVRSLLDDPPGSETDAA